LAFYVGDVCTNWKTKGFLLGILVVFTFTIRASWLPKQERKCQWFLFLWFPMTRYFDRTQSTYCAFFIKPKQNILSAWKKKWASFSEEQCGYHFFLLAHKHGWPRWLHLHFVSICILHIFALCCWLCSTIFQQELPLKIGLFLTAAISSPSWLRK